MKKSKIMKFATITGAALMTGIALVGCGSKATETAASNGGGEITIPVASHGQKAFTTDPAIAYQGANSVKMGTCETLFVLNNTTREVEPNLATKFEKIDDNNWKITLKEGIKFSNDKLVDGEAVKKSMEYIFANNSALKGIANVVDIKVNGNELTFTTEKPSAIFPRLLTSEDAIVFDTTASNDYTKGLVGTGPYILEKIDAEGNCDLVRNEKYWKGRPGLAKLHTKSSLDAKAMATALQSGEIDWGSLPGTEIKLFENNPQFNLIEKASGRLYYLYINPNVAGTSDPAVRDALQNTFDRKGIINGVYAGRGSETDVIFTKDSRFYEKQEKDTQYNVEKAKKILANAGYKDTNNDGFVDKDGKNIQLNITTYASNSFPKLAEALKAMMKEVGIDSNIKVADKIMDELYKNEFNIATYGYNTETYGDSQNYIQPVYYVTGASNFNKFDSPIVNTNIDMLKKESVDAKRAEITKNIQKEIYKENKHIYLMHTLNNLVVKKDIKNLEYGMYGVNNAELWKVTK